MSELSDLTRPAGLMPGRVTRRQALRAGGAVGLGALLAACGSDPQTPGLPTSSGPPTTPGSATAQSSAAPSTSASASSSAAPVVLDTATLAKLDAMFDSVFASTGVAGMAAGVWIGSTAWNKSAGYADLATQTAFRPDDHVRIASITKSYTATATLMLVDQGELTLQDTLESFVPGIANGSEITVAMLLGMTSGIYDFTSDQTFLDDFTANPTMPWSYDQTLAIIKNHDPNFAPGAEVQYCDSNYVLAGMILEKITGMPLDAVITSSVIGKLQLPQTSYPTTTTIPEEHPTGYVPPVTEPHAPFDNAGSPPAIVTELNPAVPAGAGAMISTLDDLRTWGSEIAEGSLLQPQTQALRLQAKPFPGQQINIGYGLGCEVLNEFVGHNGAVLGFSSVVMRRPQVDVTIAAVANESTNFTTPTSNFSYAVIKELYPDQWV
jgi:D-alanyl-D-alanine carboxypeptidase